ncbi:hypothetical protein SAMN05216236_1315 [Sedimentitalea nanhaiensis]|uniref:Uncharacterized protein n=1 Tax=Sedimentitalea nanhaiensis TaxID=999627 RepID=A0A1I7DMT0_9RHOB|nr:hypothetical protein SAMN05216236_1315 [Sedimentitalea nanhaiensis]
MRALADQYSVERIEAACDRAITVGKRSAAKVESILDSGLDRLQAEPTELSEPPIPASNVHGPSYFAPRLDTQRGEDGDV